MFVWELVGSACLGNVYEFAFEWRDLFVINGVELRGVILVNCVFRGVVEEIS